MSMECYPLQNVFRILALIAVMSSIAAAVLPGGTLDPTTVPKFVEPLVVPPVMPPVAPDVYHLAIRQFEQQVLPQGLPKTTIWGYGRSGDPLPGEDPASTFNFPAFTIETRTNRVIWIRWDNHLVDDPLKARPRHLPHLLPVDQTLHWANPAAMIDMVGKNGGMYNGPVPIVTHLHGGHTDPTSDGNPEAWYLPAAKLPPKYTTHGSHYATELEAPAGSAWFKYRNDQPATTLWYHDHALGITRLNVYAGLAGFYLLRDAVEDGLNLPGPAPQLADAPGTRYYEIPIAIQDRSFNDNGALFYPKHREFFDGFDGPFIPASDVPPRWNPEFFGNTIVANGKTWPYLEVEPRLYRLRFLNGCNSRFLILRFDTELSFHQIGSDGGLLPGAPVEQDALLLAPAERADTIVDFSAFDPGDAVVLLNLGPDEPFGGGEPGIDFDIADPATTGQVMQFRIVSLTTQGNAGTIPVALPPIDALQTALPQRDLTLNEQVSNVADIPISANLGTTEDGPRSWGHPITENPALGDTEIWRLINLTEDAHPIHLHLVMFQVVDRTPLDAEAYAAAHYEWIEGGKLGPMPQVDDYLELDATQGPEPPETGWKDTVIAYPGQVTRIIALFDIPGLYLWHCHILEHEDNEMMRPYVVGPLP